MVYILICICRVISLIRITKTPSRDSNYLNFIGRFELPAPELTPEEEKRQEQLKRHRIRSRERYRKIQDGLIIPGEPFKKICVCCGKEFEAKRSNALYCSPSCQQKYYRWQAAEERSRECVCGYCGKTYTSSRWNAKYCSKECGYKAQIKRQGERKAAERKQKALPTGEGMVTAHVE